jgi:hypothetical protein
MPSEPAPLVSVIMAAYNYARFLPRAIESALSQDYPREALQIIVVDDGSTDDTPAVVERYLDAVTYIRKPNGGVLSTVSRGLEEARGDYISLLSADDEFLPHKTRRQVEFLEAHPHVGLVYADMQVVDADGRVTAPSFWRSVRIEPQRGRIYGRLIGGNCVSGGSMMVRASLKERFHPFPKEAAWEDWWIALKVAETAEIDFLPEPVYRYRNHGRNMSLGAAGEQRRKSVQIELAYRRWLLLTLQPGEATIHEAARAWSTFGALIGKLQEEGVDLRPVLPTTAAHRARSKDAFAAGRSLAGTDRDGAACHFVRALANDLQHEGAVRAMHEILHEAGPEQEPEPEPPAALEGVRRVATVAFADELVADRELLLAYGRSFGADDDATLVVFAPEAEADDLFGRLGEALDAAGLGGEGGPDLLAVAGDDAVLAAAGRGARAVYSRRAAGSGLGHLPRLDADSIGELRALGV